jgi:Ca-activated chloride channel family protein
MSDGENNRGEIDPRAAARAAAAFGIRVFTIGVGSEGRARVPVARDESGVRYADLPVSIDEPLLREIATVTGGSYFRATDPAGLARVLREIDGMVRSPIVTRRRLRHREWYLPFLLAGALLLLGEGWIRASPWGVAPG